MYYHPTFIPLCNCMTIKQFVVHAIGIPIVISKSMINCIAFLKQTSTDKYKQSKRMNRNQCWRHRTITSFLITYNIIYLVLVLCWILAALACHTGFLLVNTLNTAQLSSTNASLPTCFFFLPILLLLLFVVL